MKKISIVIAILIFVLLAVLTIVNKGKKDNLQNTEQASNAVTSNAVTISAGVPSPSITTELQSNSPSPTTQVSTVATTSVPQTASTTIVSPSPTPSSIELSKTCMLDQWHNVFFGTIGTKEICMDIYQDGNNITAFFVYKKSESVIKLVGSLDGYKITLTDDTQTTLTDEARTILTGTLTSADEIGRFKGTFVSNGNDLPVLLEMSYACGAKLDNFYEIMASTNQEVEAFLTNLKNEIISEDKKAIAQLVNYPIDVFVGNKSTTINSSQEFIDKYNKIMNKNLVNAISDCYTKFLFNNYQGVMFGGNQYNIWITKMDDKLEILGINN